MRVPCCRNRVLATETLTPLAALATLSRRESFCFYRGTDRVVKHEPLTLKKQARELRRWQTTGEAAMWNSVRDRRFLGLKFRRQHGLGRFVLDFFCEELALAIEMDGAHHFDPVVAERDSKRTEWLQNEHAVTLHPDRE